MWEIETVTTQVTMTSKVVTVTVTEKWMVTQMEIVVEVNHHHVQTLHEVSCRCGPDHRQTGDDARSP